jgi:hypothetical protein
MIPPPECCDYGVYHHTQLGISWSQQALQVIVAMVCSIHSLRCLAYSWPDCTGPLCPVTCPAPSILQMDDNPETLKGKVVMEEEALVVRADHCSKGPQ